MAFDKFKDKLKTLDAPEHVALLKHVMSLVEISRKEMSKHYSTWDVHDRTFRAKRKLDREDENSLAKGQLAKMSVPLTFSQVLTFVAFNVMTVTQNKRFFQFEATGTEDNPLKEPLELIVERDLRKNMWQSFLSQFFLDVGRFSIGAGEVCYEEIYRHVRVPVMREAPGAFGATERTETNNFERLPWFVGNKIVSVSPYRFLPDTRLPLTRYQEGEFCGSEDMFPYAQLKGNDTLFNLDSIPKFTESEMKNRKANTRIVDMEVRPDRTGTAVPDGDKVVGGQVAITKMVCDIIPKHFKGGDGMEPLGSEDFPVRYIVWVANDKMIVRFEEAYFLHGYFPYFCGQFLTDQHQTINESLAGMCESITALITYKLNAHVVSWKNSSESRWIVDPAGVDVKSLESRSPYIFLQKNASQTGVDRYIKQFVTQDVTGNVMQDIVMLTDLLEKITGYSGMMQGQFSSGRRDATQSRAVVQGASARGKMSLGGQWDTAFEVLGKQLVVNNRQEMDFETFQRVLGPQWHTALINPDTQAPYTLEELFGLFKADAMSLASGEDFFVFDGTNPSENAYLAQSLQEIIGMIFSNPEVAGVMGYGPAQVHALIEQTFTLRGVTQSNLPAPQPVTSLMPPNVVQGPSQAAAV